MRYDSKGRLSQTTDLDGSDTISTVIYTYAASDAENFSISEPRDEEKMVNGNSTVYQPVAVTTYLPGNGPSNRTDYKNTGNADGYLTSITVLIGGTDQGTITYTYDCVNK